MVSFTSESTIHGVTYIFGPNRSIFVRIFWIFLFILSIFGFIYYISDSYTKWLIEPDIITKSRTKRLDDFPKYAVTLCPQQTFGINLRDMKKKLKNKQNFTSDEECFLFKMNEIWCKNIEKLRWEFNLRDKFTKECFKRSWAEMVSTFYKRREFDPFTTFSTGQIDVAYSNVLTPHGPCVTIKGNEIGNKEGYSVFKDMWRNDQYSKGSNTEWSPDVNKFSEDANLTSDLTIYLKYFTMQDEELLKENACDKETFKVIIHQPNEIATTFHDTFEFEYGKKVRLKIKTKSERYDENLRILGPDVRKCYFEDEKNLTYFKHYSRYYCELECLARKPKDCKLLDIPREFNSTEELCTLTPKNFLYNELNYRSEDCKCYPSCNFLQYQVDKAIEGNVTNLITIHFEHESFYVEETEKFMT